MMRLMRVLDSHLHLWDPSLFDYRWLKGSLQGRFAVEETRVAVAELDIDFIFMQSECAPEQFLEEVTWVTGLADRLGVRGIVAGARLDRGEQTSRHLTALAENPRVVGVRHLLQGAPDELAGTRAFRKGIAEVADHGWTFDAGVRTHQIPAVTGLAEAFPDLKIVLDHLGKPDMGATGAGAPSADWLRGIAALAANPRAHVKLSGLPANAQGTWSAAQVEPFFDAVAVAFGPERLMMGSDWPVSARRADEIDPRAIGSWVAGVARWAETRGFDLDAILRRNAERFYDVG